MHKYLAALTAICTTVIAPVPVRESVTATVPQLSIAVHENQRLVRRAANIVFTVAVNNLGATNALDVTICDELPESVATVTLPRGVDLFDANACATYARIAPGQTIDLRLEGRISRRARLGRARNRAIALWQGRRVGSFTVYRVLPNDAPRSSCG
jgi:uncharacterized repeat protein (TIGR01451 family)